MLAYICTCTKTTRMALGTGFTIRLGDDTIMANTTRRSTLMHRRRALQSAKSTSWISAMTVHGEDTIDTKGLSPGTEHQTQRISS